MPDACVVAAWHSDVSARACRIFCSMRIEPLERVRAAVFFTVADVEANLVSVSISKGQPPRREPATPIAISRPDCRSCCSGRTSPPAICGHQVSTGANITLTEAQDIVRRSFMLWSRECPSIDARESTWYGDRDGNLAQIFAKRNASERVCVAQTQSSALVQARRRWPAVNVMASSAR